MEVYDILSPVKPDSAILGPCIEENAAALQKRRPARGGVSCTLRTGPGIRACQWQAGAGFLSSTTEFLLYSFFVIL
jgi:hypothetical protein